jgi:hypothetical protein
MRMCTPRRPRTIRAVADTILAWASIATLLTAAQAEGAPLAPDNRIVAVHVSNFGSREDNLAFTFGSVFARGDVPRGDSVEATNADGASIPMQLDRKAAHPDGSLRHAVLTLFIPHLGRGQDEAITLRRLAEVRPVGRSVSPSDLPTDFDTVVVLRSGNRRLTVSARALLAAGNRETWLQGPLVSEWWVHGPFRDDKGVADPHLSARIGIRCYGKGKPLRLDVVVENDWTFVPGPRTEVYDAEINANGKTVFSKAAITQPSQTRWRKMFWWDEPISIYVRQDLEYLKKTRVIPNYEPGLSISERALAKMYARFELSNREPMGSGLVTGYMPMTGGRLDIAPLPQWQAMYLLSMDPRAYEMTLENADLGASFPSHFRNEKTDRPTTVKDYPNISWNSNLRGQPGQLEVPDDGGERDPLHPDPAHEPALDFIPYLVTGDRFYLEELEFWSQYNAAGSAPSYRGYGEGLVSWTQVRGQAWSLRTLAQAAYIAPDLDPLKNVLREQLKANIDSYDKHFTENKSANRLGILEAGQVPRGDNGLDVWPWEDDFFTWSVGYVQGLGDVNALPLLRWKSIFPVGRMTAPGFCWIIAAAYTLQVRDPETRDFYTDFAKVYDAALPQKIKFHGSGKLECGSAEMATALGLRGPGDMFQNSHGTDGFPAYMQPALAAAVDAGVKGAQSAWKLFESRPIKPDYTKAPGWDIVPWGSGISNQ